MRVLPMFWYYGVKTLILSEVCSVLGALPGGQLKNCMFPDDLPSSLRCRMQWCLTIVGKGSGRKLLYTESCFQTVMHQAVHNSSVSMPTIAVAETQPFTILSFYVATAAHIGISAASGE